MRTETLPYLLAIDNYHSISSAAQELFLSQTTLSNIVKKTEEELGFSLFTRTHSGVTPTEEGKQALDLIWEINSRYEQILSLKHHAGQAEPVSILLSPSVYAGLALPLNEEFLSVDPNGNLEYRTENGEEISGLIIKGDASIGLTYFSEKDLENTRLVASKYQIRLETLITDTLYALVSRDNPLSALTYVEPTDLSGMSLAMLPHFKTAENQLLHMLYSDSSSQVLTFPSISLIRQAVLQGSMAAILPGFAIKGTMDNASGEKPLVQIPFRFSEIPYEIRLCLLHRDERNMNWHEKSAVQCIRRYFGLEKS